MSDLHAPNPEGYYADQNTDCDHTQVNIHNTGTMTCQDCPTTITYPAGTHAPGGLAL